MTKNHPLAKIFDNSSEINQMVKLSEQGLCPFCNFSLDNIKGDLICVQHGDIGGSNYIEEIRKANDEIFEAVTDVILNYECFGKQPMRDLLKLDESLRKEREGKP